MIDITRGRLEFISGQMIGQATGRPLTVGEVIGVGLGRDFQRFTIKSLKPFSIEKSGSDVTLKPVIKFVSLGR